MNSLEPLESFARKNPKPESLQEVCYTFLYIWTLWQSVSLMCVYQGNCGTRETPQW